jgi:hypothetical protein
MEGNLHKNVMDRFFMFLESCSYILFAVFVIFVDPFCQYSYSNDVWE